MKCVRCSKPLTTPAATAGAYGWGPKCARIAGLLKPKRRARVRSASTGAHADERQMALELSA